MNTDPETVVKRVAVENGYGLHKDDALMQLVTIVNQLTEDQQKGVVAALEKYRQVHESLAAKWRADAKTVANGILNAALDAGRAEMAKGMTEGAAQVVKLIRAETRIAIAEQRAAAVDLAGEMKRFWYWMVGAAGAMLLAVILFTCLAR